MDSKLRILGVDISITDLLVPSDNFPALQNIVEKYDFKPGRKYSINAEQFAEISDVVEGHVLARHPGGTISNTLITLNKLIGPCLKTNFLSVVDKEDSGMLIRAAFKEAGIKLLQVKDDQSPHAATSFVITPPGGQRSTVTYGGNARDILQSSTLDEKILDEIDVLLITGSLWGKLNKEFPQGLVDLCQKQNKMLWLALPTNKDVATQNAEEFRALAQKADLVLCNLEELDWIYGGGQESSLRQLQQAFIGSSNFGPYKKQAAFVTDAENGCFIVTAQNILPVAAESNVEVVNTLGAGDTSFAGFLSGYITGMPTEAAAQIGMTLAAEKLRHNNGARLPHPIEDLHRLNQPLAYELISAAHNTIHQPAGFHNVQKYFLHLLSA